MRKCFYAILIIFLSSGCKKVLFDEPENTPRSVFKVLWQSFDRHYPAFIIKNINWDSVYSKYDTIITDEMNSNELFSALSDMLYTLKDEHAWLDNGKEMYSYYNRSYFYYYNPAIINKYLSQRREKYMFIYGKLSDSIGYLHISTFFASVSGYDYIDNILNELKNCKGLVIDIRNNAGGYEGNAKSVASRFYDKKRRYSYDNYRNGVNHSDFSEKYYNEIKPSEKANSKIRLVLITDRSVGSSGEDFTMMMRVLPQLTVVGDITHGDPGGAPNARELPNGWLFYMPTALEHSIDGELVYNGLHPDITVISRVFEHDMMIEKAVELLK